jgi:hypothetical protein
MKKNIITTTGLTLFFVLLLFAISIIPAIGTESVYAFSSGSPGGRTDSPADNSNCTGCHSGTINAGTGVASITALGLTLGYVPGQTYTITGTIVQNSINKFGFEITPEKDLDNTKSGTILITDAPRTKLVNALKAITHQSGGTSGSGSNSWSFDWIAPVAGTGSVTFYGAFNSANGFGNSSGDNIYTTSLTVIENITVDVDEYTAELLPKLYPNPATSYFQIHNIKKIERISVYDLSGKKMLEFNNEISQFDIAGLDAGYYIVNIISDGKSLNQKLIKKK